MKPFLSLLLCLLMSAALRAQDGNFHFGDISQQAFNMKVYDKDSAANAVILREFGRTSIDINQENMLVHFYHVRIKILNDQGIDHATFSIPVYKSREGGSPEEVHDIKAATFNAGSEASYLDKKNIFTENKTPYVNLIKFTLPNAKAGSVVEVQYTLSSPNVYNFREWDFQGDIPKVYSEYWADIPAIFDYHITFTGFHKLSESEREIDRNCMVFNGNSADCQLLKLGMKDVPAFREEQFMPAKTNFVSAVHFQLAAVHDFDGGTKKLTETWNDADEQLRADKDFGAQLKKGKSVFSKIVDTLVSSGDDETLKAKKIYDFMHKRFQWTGESGILCKQGIRKAFEARSGNIADINLSLVAALRAAGLNAYPVLVSTRENGLPTMFFPVISDYNYVLARLEVNNSYYMLDASSSTMPFGLFPMACINGFGRVIYDDKPSEDMEMKAPMMFQAMSTAQLALDDRGQITGTIIRDYNGYLALAKRAEIRHFDSEEDYRASLANKWSNVEIVSDSIRHLNDPDNPLEEKMTVRLTATADSGFDKIITNPFFQTFIRENPFNDAERKLPIDFGATEKLMTVFMLLYPEGYHVSSAPETSVLSLEHNGGLYVLDKELVGNDIVIKTIFQQSKPVYTEDEYPALKEFYRRVIQSHHAAVILSKN